MFEAELSPRHETGVEKVSGQASAWRGGAKHLSQVISGKRRCCGSGSTRTEPVPSLHDPSFGVQDSSQSERRSNRSGRRGLKTIVHICCDSTSRQRHMRVEAQHSLLRDSASSPLRSRASQSSLALYGPPKRP